MILKRDGMAFVASGKQTVRHHNVNRIDQFDGHAERRMARNGVRG